MKKLFTLFAIVGFTVAALAQTPQKMSYQAIVRNSANALVASTSVGIKISILQGSASGTEVYVETFTTTTNANGLATLEIGSGTPVTGTFAAINWATNTYFIKTETRIAPSTTYDIAGVSQLMSVPYALQAKTAEVATSLSSPALPTGTILPFAGINLPDGFKWCDGSAVSRTTYAALFSVIVNYWGTGDGITTFNLPDLRGRFMRGVDGTAGNDPGAATRTNSNAIGIAGNTGNNVGSAQDDAFQGHRHQAHGSAGATLSPGNQFVPRWFGSNEQTENSGLVIRDAISDGANGTPKTSPETRPKNVYVNYIIKL